jgi:hypothetical protein
MLSENRERMNKIYLKQNNQLGTPIWKHTGTLNNHWYKAVVNIASQTPFQMVFEGVRGTSYLHTCGTRK